MIASFRRICSLVTPLSRLHLIRQPCGLPPSPQGEGFGWCVKLHFTAVTIPSSTQRCNEYHPARARVVRGDSPPIPSGTQECNEYCPARARVVSRHWPPRIVSGNTPPGRRYRAGLGSNEYCRTVHALSAATRRRYRAIPKGVTTIAQPAHELSAATRRFHYTIHRENVKRQRLPAHPLFLYLYLYFFLFLFLYLHATL